ncbi:translation initiation factor eIF-2B subunit alpha-like [Anneissia japonica]|uniref:translation initiation factor eIF-2B subunit alpha-like n=1 Tax=Anneissia japonica TaxID=1529436 RepID=UPI0014256EBF|nr:translation initiation factor eIF-2B subunit alpha-like [Anneissia japonica]
MKSFIIHHFYSNRRETRWTVLLSFIKLWYLNPLRKMNNEDIVEYFKQCQTNDPDISPAVAAIKTLIEYLKLSQAETLKGLRENLKDCIEWLVTNTDSSATAIQSGCELFLRFITLASLEQQDFHDCKKILVQRGNVYLDKVAQSRHQIARLFNPFIRDGSRILTHSYSRVVLKVLQEAAAAKKRFTVYVTESNPDESGKKMAKDLEASGIPVCVILDAASGYIMEKIDMVLVGAEGVVESGGIINKIGSYQIAICAKVANKPFYVVAESFKFVRLFPLNQQDVPNEFKYKSSTLKSNSDLSHEHPLIDYTPPAYITLLFSDPGVLTPSAVSDELIKLYS